MSDPQLILDYASPRKRRRVRLPARSVLTLNHGVGGSVTVVEQLKGEAPGAVFATAFALFVAWTAGSVTVGQTKWVLRHRHTTGDFVVLAILAAAVVAELLLAALIIRNTWRRTTLSADADGLTLEFAAPFMRRRRHHWPREDVQDVALSVTQMQADAEGLGEIQIRATGTVVHLFTDHRVVELEPIERELDRALTRLRPPYVRGG
jgi:hypothetical protein